MPLVQWLDTSFIGKGLLAPNINKQDPIESIGSLILFDASRSPGSPVNNRQYTNIFSGNADRLTGATTQLVLEHTGGANVLERSEKGGLHFIPNRGLDFGESLDYALLRVDGGVKEYMRAHALASEDPHAFYISLWYRLTSNQEVNWELLNGGYQAASFIANYTATWNYNYEQAFYLISQNLTAGLYMENGVTDTVPYPGISLPNDNTKMSLFNFGAGNLNASGAQAKKYPGAMLYRAYIEDLTVSGRTPAEVTAIDQILYDNAFGIGGKFFEDTWTSPIA